MKLFSFFQRQPISPLVHAVIDNMKRHPARWDAAIDNPRGQVTLCNNQGTVGVLLYDIVRSNFRPRHRCLLYVNEAGRFTARQNLRIFVDTPINKREMIALHKGAMNLAKSIERKREETIKSQIPPL
jgi:hypothetical protein